LTPDYLCFEAEMFPTETRTSATAPYLSGPATGEKAEELNVPGVGEGLTTKMLIGRCLLNLRGIIGNYR